MLSVDQSGHIKFFIEHLVATNEKGWPHLADALLAVKQESCDTHIREVRQQLSTGATLSPLGALDDLEAAIDALAQLLRDPRNPVHALLLGPAHAAAREGQQFSVAEVFAEYALLARNMKLGVTTWLRRPLTPAEENAFQSGINGITSATLASFVRQREARLELTTAALNDFLSSLSHDLRNEMNSALLLLDMADSQLTDWEQTRTPDEKIHAGTLEPMLVELRDCRAAMNTTILGFTRILEADRLSTTAAQPRPTDLRLLLEAIARSADRIEEARSRNLKTAEVKSRINIECGDDLVVRTDPELLSTILTNFISNAAKYSTGTILLRVQVEAQLCRIGVIDQGPGLSVDQSIDIFQKFARAGRTDRDGLGLGLYIAKKAANVLKAELQVDSKPGEGACFSVQWRLDQ